ncbi:carbohydrate ABC transporter permease [Paenibacillus radicis (ex Xue et al. 2023)]|uniref:Carbohydrate ABC transporter permease n=1 Tax=Paenibacillus radicis (ex Xue et al. 2023) TaxID=2972489 RepID=A0ABT1YNU0_9BACL|nr:carbohydrate ABC transporter permease [Paenibacillus radicis (ex Xue et al. 2023)]MCR8634836.1 carbohydrate ABC transporter permease [Paenibacillus radicis (ex Xue et al. 2023)]
MEAVKRVSQARKWFEIGNYLFLSLASLAVLLPFLNIVAGSFSGGNAILQGMVTLLPVNFTLENYWAIIKNVGFWKSFSITVYITVLGTALNLVFTSLMAYGLARKDLKGRSTILLIVLFTMIFTAPIIPSYLLVKSLGMLNTLWSLMVPSLISGFNLLIMISFFQNIPDGLTEAAKIDGSNEYRTFWSIVLPLSMPVMTTIGMFYAVGHWNGYFAAMMYLRDTGLFPLQVKLRQLVVQENAGDVLTSLSSAEGIKMATIIVATVPVMLIYPFIQKHFVKGAMIGSVKG